jgi:transposase-like protein
VSIITETLRGYSLAKINITLHIVHSTKEYENRRSESFHQQTTQQERQMQRFKSQEHAHDFYHAMALSITCLDVAYVL